MLETQLYFNFKDLFRAPRLALGRRTLVMLEAIFASYLVYVFMTYIALLIEGQSLGSIWNEIHLMPGSIMCMASSTAGHIFVSLSYAFSIIIIWLGLTSVAKITVKEYKGDLFYSSRDGWNWAMKNWFPVFFGPISIAIVIGFFVVLAAFFGWLAQWPVLDILFYGLLFVIFLPTALFLVFSVMALLTGLFMSPSIVACAEEDTMGSMFGSYTLLWNQPVRLLTYTLIVVAAAFIGYHIFFWFILSAFKFIDMVFGHEWVMGDAYLAVKQVGLDLFGGFCFLPYFDFHAHFCHAGAACEPLLSGFGVCKPIASSACAPTGGCGGCASMMQVISPTVTQTISGVFVAIFSLLAYFAVPAYALATLATGFATSFIVITKHKDDQDLIKRKDADERAEAEAAEEEEGEIEAPAEDKADSPDSDKPKFI